MNRDVVKILGYGVDTFTFEDAVEYISTRRGQVVTLNPEMLRAASKDKNFSRIINSAEMVVPDGIGVQIGLKLLGHNISRIAGIDLGKALIKKFAQENKKVALVGAKPEILTKTCENLRKEIENLNIVYSHDGYFSDENSIICNLSISFLNKPSFPNLILFILDEPDSIKFQP
jgi:N-acetylglucosaminyldiphosphoundecaprenol N-acetyl-beta-D-mannosaminyltransferase